MKTILSVLVLCIACLGALADESMPASVLLIGSVNAPGKYEIAADENVWSLIQKAKGRSRLWNRRISITRETNGVKETIEYDFRERDPKKAAPEQQYLEQIRVHAGDVINFRETSC